MRTARWLILLIFLLLPLSLYAQDNNDSDAAYAEALRRIEEARVSEAEKLDLSEIALTELPPELWQLKNLKWLTLNRNGLHQLPPEIGLLSSLEKLVSYSNPLNTLPPEIGQLKKLKELYILDNLIDTLPAEIGQLTNLRVLVLSFNRLRHLPPEIGQLTNLQTLFLPENDLSNLPPETGQLKNLCTLSVAYNNLQHLPIELGNVLSPSADCPEPILDIYDNPLITPPPEVVVQGTQAILAYLREQAWYHTRQLMLSASGSVGFFAVVVLVLRWRYRRLRKPKAKRGDVTH